MMYLIIAGKIFTMLMLAWIVLPLITPARKLLIRFFKWLEFEIADAYLSSLTEIDKRICDPGHPEQDLGSNVALGVLMTLGIFLMGIATFVISLLWPFLLAGCIAVILGLAIHGITLSVRLLKRKSSQ